jgi:hypothetical protein
VVAIRTAMFNLKMLCPLASHFTHKFHAIPAVTAIVSQHTSYQMFTRKHIVLCEVRTKYLYKLLTAFQNKQNLTELQQNMKRLTLLQFSCNLEISSRKGKVVPVPNQASRYGDKRRSGGTTPRTLKLGTRRMRVSAFQPDRLTPKAQWLIYILPGLSLTNF